MDILTILYSSTGVVIAIAFVPQIMDLLKDREAKINIVTWAIFTWCSLVGLTYTLVNIHDATVIFCSIVGAVGNVTVLSLGVINRFRNKIMESKLCQE